mmetsp:Transcript_12108/g.18297  ORF Transcript_12108/g.18297 Transcript_12108/m.18297 type:complete len:482 (-) Transcript_12108:49-1494(-)
MVPVDTSETKIEVGMRYAGKVTSVTRNGLLCNIFDSSKSVCIKHGLINNIFYNAKKSRPFVRGDDIEVIITSVDPLAMALEKPYVRPLLIFDMHGVLGEREPYEQRSKTGKRKFIRRPYCVDFIQFCARHYELAVWSCGKRRNIDLSIFQGIPLLFSWCQDQSTNLYPRTSIVSSHKPLFLKEMEKVWSLFPSYDSTNSVLLDNHVEKLERNPLGSCMLVPDFFVDSVDDNELHPTNSLATHLRAMAHETPLNISKYITQRAGTEFYFPTTYSVRISGLDTPAVKTQQPTITAESTMAHVDETRAATSPLDVLLTAVCQAVESGCKCSNIEDEVFRSLQGKHGETLHLECPKSSGERAILVVSPEHGEIYFFHNNFMVQRLTVVDDHQSELREWLRSLPGPTVLDGEIHTANSGSACNITRSYVCCDVTILNGNKIEDSPHSNLERPEQLSTVGAWFFSSPFDDIEFVPPLSFSCLGSDSL